MIFLFKTLRGKLLFGSISSVILINIVFTIFISVFSEDTLRSNIIDEITNVSGIGESTYNKIKEYIEV